MAINERLVHTASAGGSTGTGTGNQEEGLVLHLDANDVDSYDGDGDVWYDVHDHEYTPATNVSEHFNTVTWVGDGANDRIITGLGFTPGFVWIKNRDTTDSHQLYDSLRGENLLYSNADDAQFLLPDWEIINDGFDLGSAYPNGRNGSTNDIVAWCFKAGVLANKSAEFNGSSSKITLPSSLTSALDVSTKTISMWIKADPQSSGYGMPFSMNSTSLSYGRIIIQLTNSNKSLSFLVGTGGSYPSVTIVPGAWYHIAVSINGSSYECFVNGTSVGTGTNNNGSDSSGDTTIGVYNASNDHYWDGKISQVRFFNSALTSSQITQLYNETPEQNSGHLLSCIAAFPLNDNANEIDGSYTATASNVAFGLPGYATRNNNGTVESAVSVNNDLGFSIATYAGNGTANQTVGNGLDSPVELLIVKRTNATGNWLVWNRDVTSGNGKYLYLDLSSSIGGPAGTPVWDSSNTTTMPTSGLFNINNNSGVNASSGTYVAYSFTSKRGVSKVGTYIGTGASGNKIYTGFEPAFLLQKETNSSSVNWHIWDNARDSNPIENVLSPNTNSAEGPVASGITFNRDGFTINTTNGSINGNGDNYVYYAIAKYTNETELADTVGFKPSIDPEDHFNTVIYTGTGTTNAITGVGFQPDLIWVKNRDTTDSHAIVDSVRGITSPAPYIASNLTDAQLTSTNMPTSVQSDGFTITGNGGRTNTSGEDYVAWCFKAGGLINKAADFNGSNSYITPSSSSTLTGLTKAVSVWIKSDNFTSTGTWPFQQGNGQSTENYIRFYNGSDIEIRWGNQPLISSGHSTGVWYHIVAQENANGFANFWINGVEIATSTTSPLSVTGDTNIGRRLNSSSYQYYFNGQMAQLRLFSSSLDSTQIAQLYNETAAENSVLNFPNGAGCIAAYPLGENANGLDGLYNGTASSVTFGEPGYLTRNTEGTIESTVSTNNDLGFSIVKWTANGSANDQLGHGLSSTPKIIIYKTLDTTSDWWTLTTAIDGSLDFLRLNSLASKGDQSGVTISNTTIPNWNFSGTNMIAYCFHSVAGVSKVGSYTGTGAAGNKVVTGFEPAFVLVKSTSGTSWMMLDNKRSTVDPRAKILQADLNTQEIDLKSSYSLDCMFFHRDGFSLQDNNSSRNSNGTKYIYYAVAKNTNNEQPHLELNLEADSYSGSGDWLDSSGNGNDGTITGASYDAELGDFFEFDGTDDKVEIPMDFSGDGSIEAWVNLTNINEDNAIASKYESGTDNRTFAWYIYGSGNAVFSIYYNTSGNGNAVQFNMSDYFTSGKWHHIMHTFGKSSRPAVYIDGEPISELSQYNSSSQNVPYSRPSVPVVLGDWYNPTNNTYDLDGKIGQFRMYSTVLSQAQIRQNYNFTKPKYPNVFHGDITGATWNASGYFDFDGSNDNVDITGNPLGVNNFTYSAWFNADTVSVANQNIITSNAGHVNYGLQVTGSGLSMYALNSSGTQEYLVSSTGLVSSGTWYHVAYVKSSVSGHSLYLNGTVVASDSSFTGACDSGTLSETTIGSANNNIQWFNGKISKVKLYNKVLTQSEITALYDEGY